METYGDPLDNENVTVGSCESQLREDLAEAMLEISITSHRAPGKCVITQQSFKFWLKTSNLRMQVLCRGIIEETKSMLRIICTNLYSICILHCIVYFIYLLNVICTIFTS